MHFQFYYPDSELSLAYGAKQREVEEYSVLSDFYFGFAVTLGTPQPMRWFVVVDFPHPNTGLFYG